MRINLENNMQVEIPWKWLNNTKLKEAPQPVANHLYKGLSPMGRTRPQETTTKIQ